MKDIKELFDWLKGKDDQELIRIMEVYSKGLVKEYRNNADLYYKKDIRSIDNFRNLFEWYFRDKLKGIMYPEQEKPNVKKLFTVKEVSKILNVSEMTVRNYVRKKLLKPIEMGERGKRKILRFSQEELDNFQDDEI